MGRGGTGWVWERPNRNGATKDDMPIVGAWDGAFLRPLSR